MMGNPFITISHDIDHLDIYKGETITIYLRPHHRTTTLGHPNTVVLELRVLNDGAFEAFSDEQIDIRQFDGWYSMPKGFHKDIPQPDKPERKDR